MNFPSFKYAAVSAFVAIIINNSTGISAPQELAARDIPDIIITYYENELKYNHDYLGNYFTSTMFFDSVGGEAFGGGYFVGFDGIDESAGLTCSFSETLPYGVIDWEAGRPVYLTGIVYRVVLATLYLEKCEFE